MNIIQVEFTFNFQETDCQLHNIPAVYLSSCGLQSYST